MSVTAVVVNYNTWSLVQRVVGDLVQDPAIECAIVVDNSPEVTGTSRDELPKGVLYRGNAHNVGFAAAVNQGVDWATTRHVALINPDVRPDPHCFRHLYATAVEYKAALVGPRFYWDEARTFRLPPATGGCRWWDAAVAWAGFHELDARTLQWYWTARHDQFWAQQDPFAEIFLSGALMLIDRQAMALPDGKILDERFFLYYEDTDLCARALLAGRPILCDPRAEAVHYWNQSPASEEHKGRLMSASHRRFLQKFYGPAFGQEIVEKAVARGFVDGRLLPVDFGILSEPPTFPVPPHAMGDGLYLEFALSSLFIPFAQASVTEPTAMFPGDVWERLAPRTYYCRLRGRTVGTVGLWKWTKADTECQT
ncbi:glycosyltransferase family 2 protein [Desulfosoma sp.]